MPDLFKTNLVLVSSPLPEDFVGDPQEFYAAMVERLEIQSPVGTNFFVVGDVEPSSDQGPWLNGGTKWYVFDATEGGYVPLDIGDSIAELFTVSPTEPAPPADDDAQIWLQTANGRVIGWYFWTGTAWRPSGNPSPSGTTAERPTTPVDLEQYYDSDIAALIQWERGAWRTVSGVRGDVKFVTVPTLAGALEQNPGWAYLGNLDQGYIGRVLGIAAKDPGLTPDANFATDSGITPQAPGDVLGEETHVLTGDEVLDHTHLVGSLSALTTANKIDFYRVDDAEDFLAPSPRPPNYAHILGGTAGSGTGKQNGELPHNAAGTMLVTSRQLTISEAPNYTGVSDAHNNQQPTLFLWCLYKL